MTSRPSRHNANRTNWTRSQVLTRHNRHLQDPLVRERTLTGDTHDSTHVAHGWTFGQITALARRCAHLAAARGARNSDNEDVALSGIGLLLAEATEPPCEGDLLDAGTNAIRDDNAQLIRMLGMHRTIAERAEKGTHRPGFSFYWRMWHYGSHPTQDAVVDRIAMNQVLDAMPPLLADAIRAIRVADSRGSAAASLRISTRALRLRLLKAVPAFVDLWWDGQQPPGIPPRTGDRQGGTCRYGHPAAWNGRYMVCRTCATSQDRRSRRKKKGDWL